MYIHKYELWDVVSLDNINLVVAREPVMEF